MRYTNASMRYTNLASILHWMMALLIIAGFSLGLYMHDLPFSPQKLKYYSWHKWLGVTVCLLAALRLLWRLTHRPPALGPEIARWQIGAAHAAHMLLYILFFAVPISGWLMSSAKGFPTVYLGLIQLPDLVGKDKELGDTLRVIHQYLNYGLLAIVVAHVGGAIKHTLQDKSFLGRIMPGRR